MGDDLMKKSMITVEQVKKSFNKQLVLENVSFSIHKGEIIGLIGPNGAGKTTLIRLMNGVIETDDGKITVGGFSPNEEGDHIRKISGVLTEGAGLYHGLSGIDNLRFFASLYGNVEEERIQSLLDQFGLKEHQHKNVGEYSTGMKKRLGLVRALLHQPEILFLDEPTNGLDPEGIHFVMDTLKEINQREGITIILCSHVLHQLAEVCHRFLFLDRGTIIESGTLDQLEQKYLTEIHLQIETDENLGNIGEFGVPVEKTDATHWRFTLPGKKEIPPLLTALLQKVPVYSAEIINRDLESLYFRIRKEENHV